MTHDDHVLRIIRSLQHSRTRFPRVINAQTIINAMPHYLSITQQSNERRQPNADSFSSQLVDPIHRLPLHFISYCAAGCRFVYTYINYLLKP
jgi:hypothetical protein